MPKTFPYTLTPTPEQEQAWERALWRCRALYTTAREERTPAWERHRVPVSSCHQKVAWPELQVDLLAYTKVHAQVWQDVLLRLDRAFPASCRRLANGESPGYPRFQGSTRSSCCHRFPSPQYGNGAVREGGVLSLSKIGRIGIRLHRPLEGAPTTVTLGRAADGWSVCVSCAAVPVERLPLTGEESGIDVGLPVFCSTADGRVVEPPRHSRQAQKQLKPAQRRIARRTPGSQRRRTTVLLRKRKQHQTIARQRRDCPHTTALALVRPYDVLYLEDLQVRNRRRRRPAPQPQPHGTGGYLPTGATATAKAGRNQSIQDAGGYAFRVILAGTAACAGKRVEAVPPALTTQDCSPVRPDGTSCGERGTQSLCVRTHVCTSCGLILDRAEHAAARTIVWAGQARRGVGAVLRR